MERDVILSVRDLDVKFTLRGRVLHAIRGVSLDVYRGESLAIVGESGSGKSVFTKTFMGLTDQNGYIDAGSILYDGKDLAAYQGEKQWRTIRGGEIAMVLQDPMTSLNPLKTIGRQIEEAVILHQHLRGAEARRAVLETLSDVGIDDPERRYKQYPHEFSGGMRQRVVIAIAVACRPKILICDEPTTALDVTIQAQILDLLRRRIIKGGAPGPLPEQVVPAEGTAMSISSNYPLSLLRTAAEDFMVLLFGDSGGNGDLYFYHYDETLPTHADTTLTVWSLADSATARLAVNAYKKANPEVDVTFETAVQTDTDDVSAAINDALTQLNTELLAGEGPDVLLLDRVDYTTYINKGMLADMSDTVPLDALQSNIIDPFMTDGRAYVLPARFIVPALCGDAGTLDGLTDLNDLQDAVLAAAPRPDTEQFSDEYYTALPDDQKYALALASGVDFAKLLLPSSANALLHDGALDADALTKIFTFVKTTADYYGMADYINTEMDGVSSQSYDNSDIVTIDAQQDEYSTCSRAKFGWMDVATPYAVIAMARTNDIFDADAEAVPVDMIPMPGLTQGAYNPQVLVGVNANSKNPDAAKGLAAAFFGTDVQSQYCSDGTTVRADCLREKLDAVKATVIGAKTGKVTGAYVGDLDAFYANCTTPVLFPVMLQQNFINHAQAIIDGSEDVAAAVAGVQSDLALYLAEQK